MWQRKESFFKGYQDTKLFYQTWESSNPEFNLVITHGQGEHSECYHRLVSGLAGMPAKVWAWDWRGHGRSEGLRGYAEDFSEYVHDYELFMQLVSARTGQEKLILLGHSMGGLIQLKGLIANPDWKPVAQVLSSPLLGIAVPVPAWKSFGAHLLSAVAPKITLGNEIEDKYLTKDPEVLQEFSRDNLRHTKISSGVYLGSLEAMDWVQQMARSFVTPTLLQVPKVDPVVSTPESILFFNKIAANPKVLKIYDHSQHEIYNDTERESVYSDLRDFLSQILSEN
jgi:alpha-beta hydrolase superfamily lysophospholipase